jgi:hypothetical protein
MKINERYLEFYDELKDAMRFDAVPQVRPGRVIKLIEELSAAEATIAAQDTEITYLQSEVESYKASSSMSTWKWAGLVSELQAEVERLQDSAQKPFDQMDSGRLTDSS